MREKFVQWFEINFPGTPLDGPTEASEFKTWTAGYYAATERALEILDHHALETRA